MEAHELKPVDPAAFTEVHKRIGVALWLSQAFEDTLSYFVTLILKLPPSRAEQEVRALLEKTQSKTLGNLIAELRKANTTNSVAEFEQRVNRFLDERNWLVHESWRQHHRDLFQPAVLPPLLARLDSIADEASALQESFGQIVHQWTLAQGFSQADIDAETKRILAARGAI